MSKSIKKSDSVCYFNADTFCNYKKLKKSRFGFKKRKSWRNIEDDWAISSESLGNYWEVIRAEKIGYCLWSFWEKFWFEVNCR